MPSPATIVTPVTDLNATGLPNQAHLVWEPGTAAWWLFHLSSTQDVAAVTSTDFATWTSAGTAALGRPHNSEGRNFGFNVALGDSPSIKAIHVASSYRDGSGHTYAYHGRIAPASTTSFSFTEAQTGSTDSGTGSVVPSGASEASPPAAVVGMLSTEDIVDANPYGANGDALGLQVGVQGQESSGSFTLAPSWASAGSVAKQVSSTAAFFVYPSGAAELTLAICDNASPSSGSFTNLAWSKSTGSWSTPANVFATDLSAASATGAWSAVRVGDGYSTDVDVHAVAVDDGSTTFRHARFDGSAWSAGDAIPAGSYGSGSNLFLATDGTAVNLICIDSTGAVAATTWTSVGGWTAWGVLAAANGNARQGLSGSQSLRSGKAALIWVETSGGTSSIVGLLVDPTSAPPVVVMIYGLDGASEGCAYAIVLGSADGGSLAEADFASISPGATDGGSSTSAEEADSALGDADGPLAGEETALSAPIADGDGSGGLDVEAPTSTSTSDDRGDSDAIVVDEAGGVTITVQDVDSGASDGSAGVSAEFGDLESAAAGDDPLSAYIDPTFPASDAEEVLAGELWSIDVAAGDADGAVGGDETAIGAEFADADGGPLGEEPATIAFTIAAADSSGFADEARADSADVGATDLAAGDEGGGGSSFQADVDSAAESEVVVASLSVSSYDSSAAGEPVASIGLGATDSGAADAEAGGSGAASAVDGAASGEETGARSLAGDVDSAAAPDLAGDGRAVVGGLDSAGSDDASATTAEGADADGAAERAAETSNMTVGVVDGAVADVPTSGIVLGSADGSAADASEATAGLASGLDGAVGASTGSADASVGVVDAASATDLGRPLLTTYLVVSIDSVSEGSAAGPHAALHGWDAGGAWSTSGVSALAASIEAARVLETIPRILLGSADGASADEQKSVTVVVDSTDGSSVDVAASTSAAVGSDDGRSVAETAGVRMFATAMDSAGSSEAGGFVPWGSLPRGGGYASAVVASADSPWVSYLVYEQVAYAFLDVVGSSDGGMIGLEDGSAVGIDMTTANEFPPPYPYMDVMGTEGGDLVGLEDGSAVGIVTAGSASDSVWMSTIDSFHPVLIYDEIMVVGTEDGSPIMTQDGDAVGVDTSSLDAT